MRVGIVRETRTGERRVAATPETVKQLTGLGYDVVIESGAGKEAGFSDAAYTGPGATISSTVELGKLDICAHVRPLEKATVAKRAKGAVTIGLASPASELETVQALADAKVTAFAPELVPRFS